VQNTLTSAGKEPASARVERTLLSAAFDFVFDFDFEIEIELKERTQRAAPWKSGASAPRQLPKLQPASARRSKIGKGTTSVMP
jgi:hypothetical protein